MSKGYVNKFTGLVCPFRTPYNTEPDKGLVNTGEDLTVQSDYEPVSQLVTRVQRGDLSLLHQQSDLGYEYDDIGSIDLNADDADDYIDQSADVLDKHIDLEDYIRLKTAEGQGAQANVSAGSTDSKDEKRTDEARNDAEKVSFEENT